MLVALLVGHALCDYPLQGDFLARAKRPGGVVGVPWRWAMWAHCLIHAGAVWLVTGSLILAGAEYAAHTVIDTWKCSKGWGTADQERAFTIDQWLHIACKVLWAVAVAHGVR